MQRSIEERQNDLASPYHIFKFSIRSELTRKNYERRIRRFFDFIEFNPGLGIEQRCNDFAEKARSDAGWVLNKIITFLQFQKERTEKGEITPATLSISLKHSNYFVKYLILIGVYSSALSVAEDTELRQIIRRTVVNEVSLLDSMGTAIMEDRIRKKVTKIAKEQEIVLLQQTGVESSLDDSEINQYVHAVIQEVKSSKVPKK
jgi:hypothetical protein